MMASPSNVLLCAIVASCVAGVESLADPKAVAEQASRALGKLASECADYPELVDVCDAAAVIEGAVFLVDFTVTYFAYQKHLKDATQCNILKSDIDLMAGVLNKMAKRTRKWDEFIDSKSYGNLRADADDILAIGETFLEDTRVSIFDTQNLLVATSGAHQVLPLVTTGAPVFLSYMVGQCSGLDKKLLLPALVLGIAAVGLQGCNENQECPPKAMLHGHLIFIKSNMSLAIGFIHNLRDCVATGYKSICSGKEMHKRSDRIRSALDHVKANMNTLEEALGMRRSNSLVMPAVHTETLPSVNSANLLAFASTTSQAEADLAFMSRGFEALAVKGYRLSQCAAEGWCPFQFSFWLIVLIVFLLAAPIGLIRKILVCSRRTSASEITNNQTNGNYEAMSDEYSDDASSTSCCLCAQRHPLWTLFLLYMPFLALVVGLGVVNHSCIAAVLDHHRMHLIASKASQIHDNLQSQVECAQLGTLCSLEERAHLQKQVTHMVKDTVSELHETLAPSAGLVEAQIERQQQCTTMVACSPEELMRRQLRLLLLVKGAFSLALSEVRP